ncbi:microtubule-associated proteins 70-2 [Striga asiatica]|uniref:Microtubule-associated proteins 70-2 n=1 Tax=Striga asiatica TaxID=4170 RepID=A0A5A7Q277_STRAF|nr:microtubule-associated proteins 70-2 [Striga asiatica]
MGGRLPSCPPFEPSPRRQEKETKTFSPGAISTIGATSWFTTAGSILFSLFKITAVPFRAISFFFYMVLLAWPKHHDHGICCSWSGWFQPICLKPFRSPEKPPMNRISYQNQNYHREGPEVSTTFRSAHVSEKLHPKLDTGFTRQLSSRDEALSLSADQAMED